MLGRQWLCSVTLLGGMAKPTRYPDSAQRIGIVYILDELGRRDLREFVVLDQKENLFILLFSSR